MIMLGYCEMKWLNLVTVYIKGTSPTFNISNYHEISCLLTWVKIFLYISWSLTECFISSADIFFLPWWTAVKSLLSMSLPISLLYIFQVVHLLCHNTRTLFPTFSDSFFLLHNISSILYNALFTWPILFFISLIQLLRTRVYKCGLLGNIRRPIIKKDIPICLITATKQDIILKSIISNPSLLGYIGYATRYSYCSWCNIHLKIGKQSALVFSEQI